MACGEVEVWGEIPQCRANIIQENIMNAIYDLLFITDSIFGIMLKCIGIYALGVYITMKSQY